MKLYIVKDEQQAGPFEQEEIERQVLAGEIDPRSLAWHEGMTEWRPLHTILTGPGEQTAGAPPLPARAPLVYIGFWRRVIASIMDGLLITLVTLPVLIWAYGWEYFTNESLIQGQLDFWVSYVFPAAAVILFWLYKQATPGKMAVSAKLVHADTGAPPSALQCIGRYFAYFLSAIPLLLGFLWVAFDKRKQGWHDKLANTVVVRDDSAESNALQ